MPEKIAVGYCRISRLMQIENTSLENKENKIMMYFKLHDTMIDEMFIRNMVYGKPTYRPKYYQMISCIKENDANMIIVYKNYGIH